MVSFTDLKLYNDDDDALGGSIDTGNPIQSSTPNNLFSNFTRSQLISGSTKYKCMFIKNDSAETMHDMQLFISSGTPLDNTAIAFAFDEAANPYDGAVGLNGTNDWINCGNHTDLWSRSLTKFAFAIQIYPQASGDGNDRNVVSHGGASSGSFRLIIDSVNPTRARFVIKDSLGVNHTVSTFNLAISEWNEIACSFDSSLLSNNLKIFHNGVLEDTTTWTGSINISDNLELAGSSNDFDGYIRDFKFWFNNAISSDEGEELFETGEIDGDSPSYHLNFSERTGATTTDRVSLTKTASLENGAFWKLNPLGISNEFEEPRRFNNTWYHAEEKPDKINLRPGQYFPIWVRVVVEADTNATPFVDDSGIFSVSFDIETTGTGTGGTPGTGGGTGGNPGGSGTIDYKIAVSGDWGNTSTTTDVLDLIKDQDYDLVLGVGDNAYDDSSASSWCNKFRFLQNKMESAWGNHEYEEDGGLSPYKNFFGYGRSYHYHRFQNCLILILDSNDDKSGVDLDDQRVWARETLEQFKNDTNVVWRIAVMHHPWFGDGSKHTENEFDQVQKFHKLFTDYDVNFVYTGHNHNWQRTHQVSYNSGDPQFPNVVDSSSPYSRSGAGLIYIVSGTGGHDDEGDLYSLPDDEDFFAYRNKSQNGVHELVASNGGKTLTGKFRNIDGGTNDTFTITA